MADNTRINEGTNGDTIATDDIGGVKYQRVKVAHGADGTATDTSATAPLPALLYGTSDAGDVLAVPTTPEGHLEVAVHSPTLPFGSVHVESITPLFQVDGVYGVNSEDMLATVSSGGGATTTDGAFVVSTGTTVGAFGALQTRKRLRYRAGQGILARFTARFPTNIASSILVAGIGHAEDGVYVGYSGTSFGLLYSRYGRREVQTLTITTGASGAGNATVILNGTANTIAVSGTGATAAERIQRTVQDLSVGTYAGWTAEPVGTAVRFVRNSAGDAAGAFSISGGTIAGSFAETSAGLAATDTWTASSSWNVDPLDGNGRSGYTLDPTKFQVYQVGIQYLGGGAITLDVLTTSVNTANNPTWTRAHTIQLPGTLTRPNFGNPSFPFTLAAYSAGSSTNVSVESGSAMGGIEGPRLLLGPRFSYAATSTATTSSAFTCLFTIRNSRYYGGRTSQVVVSLLSIGIGVKHTQPISIFLVRDAVLAGYPSFSQNSTNSPVYVDTSATTCTFSNSDLVWSCQMGETGTVQYAFADREISLQPGESMTVCARTTTGSAAYVSVSLNTREDQ